MRHEFGRAAIVAALLGATGSAGAASLQADRIYVGGGLSSNDLDGEEATGYQGFVGYELPLDMGSAEPAIEIGYWNSGDFDVRTPAGEREVDADGIWATGVASVPLGSGVNLLGRLGADFGDDDGLMAGGGLGFDVNERVELRGEYVVRDDTESLQANFVYGF